MSHYSCTTCGAATTVIETRVSFSNIRRRRKCFNEHKFTTVELPHDTADRIASLIDWLGKQGLDPELVEYGQDMLKAIMRGDPPSEEG